MSENTSKIAAVTAAAAAAAAAFWWHAFGRRGAPKDAIGAPVSGLRTPAYLLYLDVATRNADRMLARMMDEIPFNATAVLRPSLAALVGQAPPFGATGSHGPLEFYDPLRVARVKFNEQSIAMARKKDLTILRLETLTDLDRKEHLGRLMPEWTDGRPTISVIIPTLNEANHVLSFGLYNLRGICWC